MLIVLCIVRRFPRAFHCDTERPRRIGRTKQKTGAKDNDYADLIETKSHHNKQVMTYLIFLGPLFHQLLLGMLIFLFCDCAVLVGFVKVLDFLS